MSGWGAAVGGGEQYVLAVVRGLGIYRVIDDGPDNQHELSVVKSRREIEQGAHAWSTTSESRPA